MRCFHILVHLLHTHIVNKHLAVVLVVDVDEHLACTIIYNVFKLLPFGRHALHLLDEEVRAVGGVLREVDDMQSESGIVAHVLEQTGAEADECQSAVSRSVNDGRIDVRHEVFIGGIKAYGSSCGVGEAGAPSWLRSILGVNILEVRNLRVRVSGVDVGIEVGGSLRTRAELREVLIHNVNDRTVLGKVCGSAHLCLLRLRRAAYSKRCGNESRHS